MLVAQLQVFDEQTAPKTTSGRIFSLNKGHMLVYVSDYSFLQSQFPIDVIHEVQQRIDKEIEYLIKHVFERQPQRDRNVTELWKQAVKLATERVETIESVFYQHRASAKIVKSVLQQMDKVHVAVVYFSESAMEHAIVINDAYAQGQQMVTYHQKNYLCDSITFHTPSLTGDRTNLIQVVLQPDIDADLVRKELEV